MGTCPDGQVYQVGDNKNSCASIACVGGTPGTCNQQEGAWSYTKVECAAAVEPAPTPGSAVMPVPPRDPTQLVPTPSVPGDQDSLVSGANRLTTLFAVLYVAVTLGIHSGS